MAFRLWKLQPVSLINSQPVSTQNIGIRLKTNGFKISVIRNRPTTTVQKSAAVTEEITGIPTIIPQPTGTTDPGTTDAAAAAVSAAAKKEYDTAVLRLKNTTGQITSLQETITKQESTLLQPSAAFGNFTRNIRLNQIKTLKTQVEALKVKAKEQELEIERLKALL